VDRLPFLQVGGDCTLERSGVDRVLTVLLDDKESWERRRMIVGLAIVFLVDAGGGVGGVLEAERGA
jgi:hypothetical protein